MREKNSGGFAWIAGGAQFWRRWKIRGGNDSLFLESIVRGKHQLINVSFHRGRECWVGVGVLRMGQPCRQGVLHPRVLSRPFIKERTHVTDICQFWTLLRIILFRLTKRYSDK